MGRTLRFVAAILLCLGAHWVWGQEASQVRRMEASGDAAAARAVLWREAQSHPGNATALTAYAEFLDRYGDPDRRAVYRRLLTELRAGGDSPLADRVARRLALLDLIEGEPALSDSYAARSSDAPSGGSGERTSEVRSVVVFPGPIRSFARMAAVPPDARPEDVLPALARNVVTSGYQASGSHEALDPTEYLKLVHRYLAQARELQAMAGEDKTLRIDRCESPQVADLLRVLGYRMRGGCGSELVLETVNAGRAFLTTDSGFPVQKLEQALRMGQPFTYDYHPTPLPVVFGTEYWAPSLKAPAEFIDAFIGDPAICRLYLAMSKLDPSTAETMRKAIPLVRLKAFAHVLDYYGGLFEIRDGKAVVPGGARSAAGWGELVGVSPDQGSQFFDRLVAKDDGWLASLYDALARINGPARDYLTEPARMKRFYNAVRGKVTTPGPARPVFRSNADMMLLTSRLRLDPDGKPHIPGDLAIWKNLFVNHPTGKYDSKLTRLAAAWKEPDDLIEALFALCRKNAANQPLRIFMTLSEIDRNRAKPLSAATVDRLAREFDAFGSHYAIFSESGALSEKSITSFLDTARDTLKTRDPLLRSDIEGSFQALIGLWQVLVRQGSIPDDRADAAFSGITAQFAQVRSTRELFDASRKGVDTLLAGAQSALGDAPLRPQEKMVALLAGAGSGGDEEAHSQAASQIERILDAQRIVSLDDLFQLSDRLSAGLREKADLTAAIKLASRISELHLPASTLSSAEKTSQDFGFWAQKHIDAQRSLNLRGPIERAAGDPEKLKELRGLLAPLLRDTLMGFNYSYYSPPGAQVLYTNPLFVRSHDFIGYEASRNIWPTAELAATGWPSNGGGRLVGSLSGLPYALAQAEQDFLVPTHTQALIWTDLAPQMIVSATIPRWWSVTPLQVHWVGLHERYAREVLARAASDQALRRRALAALAPLASPGRASEVGRLLEGVQVKDAIERITPAELFALARALASSPGDEESPVLAELREIGRSHPGEANYAAISRAFGTPKPTLANSYRPELLGLRTFPTLMGYSSRIMAESWESNTLYWAELADELYLTPADLNMRIPEWTQKLVERIFATNLDDWPAVLRSLRMVGDDERARRVAAGGEQKAALEGFRDR